MRRWVSFHGPLWSEKEFRQHLPVVLRIHSPLQDVYRENSGEVLPKFCLGEERSMETDLIYASAGGIRTYPHLLDSRNTA